VRKIVKKERDGLKKELRRLKRRKLEKILLYSKAK
jgi:hypothetical protein